MTTTLIIIQIALIIANIIAAIICYKKCKYKIDVFYSFIIGYSILTTIGLLLKMLVK